MEMNPFNGDTLNLDFTLLYTLVYRRTLSPTARCLNADPKTNVSIRKGVSSAYVCLTRAPFNALGATCITVGPQRSVNSGAPT